MMKGYDALFDICRPKTNQIFKAIRRWSDNPLEAASGLAEASLHNEKLKESLNLLLTQFDAVNNFTERLAQLIAKKQGGGRL